MGNNNTNLVDRYLSELLNAGNFTGARDILAPNFIFYGPSTQNGLDAGGFQRHIKETRAAFPNKRFTELDRIGDGDRVALRFRMTGTHHGPLNGIPPTGATIDVEGCDVIYIDQGRISEVRAYFDLMPVVQNLLVSIPAKIIGGLVGNLFSR
ncbi:MAG: ester cyclase [Acidobacteriaceae bacterium]